MPSPLGTSVYLCCVVLLSGLAVRPARADLLPASKSDKFGVRANSDAGSLTANQTDYLGDTVPDKTIDELQDGSDLIGATDDPKNVIKFTLINAEFGLDPFTGLPYFCSAQQACLGNHAIVNLGVIGYAYLREPLSFDVSDRISI